MKNILKYTFILAGTFLVLVGCEEDLIVYNNSTFVQLANDSDVAIVENSGTVVEIPVQLGAPQSSDTTVNFDVTGDASRYSLSSTSLVIPAGETSGSINLTAVDDDEINGDVEVTVALSASSGLPVGLGGEGINKVSKTITIVDDNVPCNNYVITVVADRWGSEVMWDIIDTNGSVVVSGGPYDDLPAGATQTDVVNVNIPDGCYTFRAFDWYGDGWTAGGASYTVQCGALVAVVGDDDLTGIPGLNINTVPVNPLYGSRFWPGSPTSGVAPYVGHAEQADFCVNQ
ncbi:MAG: hypothetical protein KDD26_08540 [Winogradskyella sp.]|nr:hypothetical protein [Winogradskyella sp.]